MRTALRGVTTAVISAGMVASSFALVGPLGASVATATSSDTGTAHAHVTVLHTPYVGRTCVIGVRLTSAGVYVKGERVVVQAKEHRKGARWTTIDAVTTKSGALARVERPGSVRAIDFRAIYVGSGKYGANRSNVVTCTPKSLRYGSGSLAVKKVQKKLKKLRIRPATTSGHFDANTLEAVYAFQKSKLMTRTGVVDAKTYERIIGSRVMTPSAWCKDADTICIDISKQVGYLKIKGKRYTIPVSSGGGYYFFNPQSKAREFAHTPRGTFHVYYKVPGATTGPLGTYYWISFFTGGYGVHGSASVPAYAASHGCVREPRTIEQWVYAHLPLGAQVHVHE